MSVVCTIAIMSGAEESCMSDGISRLSHNLVLYVNILLETGSMRAYPEQARGLSNYYSEDKFSGVQKLDKEHQLDSEACSPIYTLSQTPPIYRAF
jgi:hypothetical protein